MNYSQEMFDQTLKAADLSTVDFEHPIEFDAEIISCGEKYLNALLGEPMIAMQCEWDPDRYYYMLASHALYAAFCIANWERMGQSRTESLEGVMALDAVVLMRMNWQDIETEDVDWYASTVFDMAINDFQFKFGQEYTIDNKNEYILGLLMAFFVIGYNLHPEYFDEE